jgi:hypothetical protein
MELDRTVGFSDKRVLYPDLGGSRFFQITNTLVSEHPTLHLNTQHHPHFAMFLSGLESVNKTQSEIILANQVVPAVDSGTYIIYVAEKLMPRRSWQLWLTWERAKR